MKLEDGHTHYIFSVLFPKDRSPNWGSLSSRLLLPTGLWWESLKKKCLHRPGREILSLIPAPRMGWSLDTRTCSHKMSPSQIRLLSWKVGPAYLLPTEHKDSILSTSSSKHGGGAVLCNSVPVEGYQNQAPYTLQWMFGVPRSTTGMCPNSNRTVHIQGHTVLYQTCKIYPSIYFSLMAFIMA